nr:hypothetical protein [Tanacetum cinerariifolium]
MNSYLVAPRLASRCSSTRAVTWVLRGSSFLSSTTSFSNVVTWLLNRKTDVKLGSIDERFVALVVGSGVGDDCCGVGVKDGNDYGMMVENTGSEHKTNESGSESDQEKEEEKIKDEEEEEEEEEEEIVKTPSNDSADEDEIKVADKAEGDEDKEIDYTTKELAKSTTLGAVATETGETAIVGGLKKRIKVLNLNSRADLEDISEDFQNTIMSDSEDSTVTYTTVSSPYEGRSGDPEYIPPEDEVFPAEEQPLPVAASPTTDSPGYIPESDPDEDPKDDDDEDPKDDDDEEEDPFGDDADEEDEEQDEDDDDEEEEHSASAESIPPPPTLRVTARISFRSQSPTLSFTKEDAERFLAMPIPPPSLLTLLSSLLLQIPSPPLPASPLSSSYHYLLHHHPYSYYLLTVELIDLRLPFHLEREQDTQDIYGVMEDAHGRKTDIFQRVEALVDESQYHYETGRLVDQEARCSREAWSSLHEEIHEVDHHEKLVFLVILKNLEKCLKTVLVLVLIEYLLMEHPGQLMLTQKNRLNL